jgi:hypothetical protein
MFLEKNYVLELVQNHNVCWSAKLNANCCKRNNREMVLPLLQSASSSYLLLNLTPCESDEMCINSLAAITLE